MAALTTKDKITIGELRAITHLDEGDIIRVFKALAEMHFAGEYYAEKPLTIPLIGEFEFSYNGVTVQNNQRVSEISCSCNEIHDSIKETIQTIEDYHASGDESKLMELSGFKTIDVQIKRELRKVY